MGSWAHSHLGSWAHGSWALDLGVMGRHGPFFEKKNFKKFKKSLPFFEKFEKFRNKFALQINE
jgi:hypothetical protein